MKQQAPFDLNCAIQDWRESLAQSPAFRSENLDELEAHLRDSVAKLQTRGLSAEEAFMVAAKRIGENGLLEKEFAKVNTRTVWLDRVLWMLIGHQVWLLISMVCSNASAFANGTATRLAVQRSSHGAITQPAPGEYTLYALSSFITPLALALVTVIAWKYLLKSDGKVRGAMARWLVEPMWLAVGLFVFCVGFLFLANYFESFFVFGPWWWWQMAVIQSVKHLPEYGVGAILIAIIARKRLRRSRV